MVIIVPWWIIYTALAIVGATLLLLILWLLAQAWFRMFDDMLGARKIRNRFWAFMRAENQKEQDAKRPRPVLDLGGEDSER